jgi:tetratricopeptide (TPR) repeat protein
VGLSSNYVNEISFGTMPSETGFPRSKEAALKALTYDPENGLAYSRLGIVQMWSENDLVAAAKSFERALTLDPNDANLLMNTSQFLNTIDRPHDAIRVLKAAAAIDPVNVNVIANLGGIQSCTGEFADGIASLRTALALNPAQAVLHYQIAMALMQQGDPNAALAEIQHEQDDFRRIGLPMIYHALERKADSDAALAELIATDGDASAYNIANAYAYKNDKDQAFKWLDRAAELHDPGLASVTWDELFTNIHSDPRWPAYLAKIGKSPQQLAMIKFKLPASLAQ